jgi:hypothetical protein
VDPLDHVLEAVDDVRGSGGIADVHIRQPAEFFPGLPESLLRFMPLRRPDLALDQEVRVDVVRGQPVGVVAHLGAAEDPRRPGQQRHRHQGPHRLAHGLDVVLLDLEGVLPDEGDEGLPLVEVERWFEAGTEPPLSGFPAPPAEAVHAVAVVGVGDAGAVEDPLFEVRPVEQEEGVREVAGVEGVSCKGSRHEVMESFIVPGSANMKNREGWSWDGGGMKKELCPNTD